MRRLLLVLTVAALMAAMAVTAGPAKADISLGVGGSSFGGSSFGGSSFGGSSFDLGDGFAFDVGDDDADDFNNVVFFSQVDSELDTFAPEGIEFV